ncbi:MAG TPA: ferredoxin reductase family protein [Candidatus Polarisedimenticolaceae bacterium]|nr:ferredoxin reductase family protein [Candidatus Polarisedimenticolaceae bacterium]
MRNRTIRWLALAAGIALALPMLWQWYQLTALTATTSSEYLITIGRLAGMVMTFGVLMQLILMSRFPGLERSIGLERLVTIHRYNGYTIFYALLAHPFFLVLGYQIDGKPGLIQQYIDFILHYPDVWRAWIASLLLFTVVATSIVISRRRLRYEWWYFIHLMVYAAILLGFGHQLKNGGDFIGHPWFIAYWYFLYLLAFGLVGFFRFGRPAWRLWHYRFRVDRVVPEAEGIHSIYVRGRGIDKLRPEPGQFFVWRFLDGERWWQAHPFSMSQAARPDELRLTFKAVGDFTGRLHLVKPGTPVVLDGPRGSFTLELAKGNKLLFLAGGIGITPLRTMIEALPSSSDAHFIYACRNEGERALGAEFERLAQEKKVKVHYVYQETTGRLTPELLTGLIPDIARREVFLCGPPPMMKALTDMMVGLGVKPERIYSERFAFLGL